MKISIITTIYKAEKDLPRLLDSMMQQRSQDLEFLLIDNGSPDRCGDICRDYAKKDSRFRVYEIENNVGYIRARNIGIKESFGDYIGFCDSDDYLELGGYDHAIKVIEEFNCDLYIAGYRTIYNESQTTNISPYKRGIYDKEGIRTEIMPQAFGYIHGKNMLHGFAWKQIFRKDIIERNHLFFSTELQPYEDQIFNIDMLQRCKSVYIDDNIIYNYVANEQSITAKMISNFNEQQEWKRIKMLWNEKMMRTTQECHVEACCNQVLHSLYSLLLNMTKNTSRSCKELACSLDSIMRDDSVAEIFSQLSKQDDIILRFIQWCLCKRKYIFLFRCLRLALTIHR